MKHFDFRLLLRQAGRWVLLFIMEARRFYWNLPVNKPSKIFNLRLTEDIQIKYLHQGDIAQILYMEQVLIPFKKSFEYSTLKLFSSLIKENQVILDIGANTGALSIFFSKLTGQMGKVFSFEPDSKTFITLEKNLNLNSCENVTAFNFAISDKVEEVVMERLNSPEVALMDGDAYKYIRTFDPQADNKKNRVKAITLDTFDPIFKLDKVDMIKIDVEGAELLVLKGAEKFIKKFKPTIIFEMAGQWTKRFNYKPYEVFVLLHSFGYEMDEYDPFQWLAKPIS